MWILILTTVFHFLQYIALAFFGLARGMQWGCYFYFINSGRYPAGTTSRMLGFGNLIIALFGDGLQYVLALAVDRVFNGSYVEINLALTFVLATTLYFPVHLHLSRQQPH
jgi:hypothetical protein